MSFGPPSNNQQQEPPTSGSGPPSEIPKYIGQEYLDMLEQVVYKSFGVSSVDDWIQTSI